jgi:nucleotide-binding universal stress UspA family protein
MVYQKIVVPLDGSSLAEQILPYARFFAEGCAAPVELLRVNDPDVRPPFWPPLPDRDYLQQVSGRYFPSSLKVAQVEESGKPAGVILSRAKADPNSLIAMTTHGLSGIRRWLLGSVASKVIQSAVNPVLLVRAVEGGRPASELPLKTVFIPLDGSALAEKIFPHIVPLVGKLKLHLNLVRVYDVPVAAYPLPDAVFVETLARQREAIRREAETYLDAKAEELRGEGLEHVSTTVLEGDPAGEIIDIARTTSENMIAMSTHGASGVGRWVLGSIAAKVVQYSGDPVLLIRPQ